MRWGPRMRRAAAAVLVVAALVAPGGAAVAAPDHGTVSGRIATTATEGTCSLAAAAADPRLKDFRGRIVRTKTGEILFRRGSGAAVRTASVLKVLTSAAALEVLGPDHRLVTKVVRGSRPGQVVLVGGGDPTLSRTKPGTATVYPGAPRLATLAAKVKTAWGDRGRIREVVLDASYFGGPTYHESWDPAVRTGGSMPKVTALMVDGDRADPAQRRSPRGTDPVRRAGVAFARLLGATVTVSKGTAPRGAEVLGTVRSQPVSKLVGQTLLTSDNAIAEALARVTAIESGAGKRFADLQRGVVRGLRPYGLDTTDIRVVDGSGLSRRNAVPPKVLTALFRRVLHHRDGALAPVFDGLPVAGRTGSLGYPDRFAGASSRADGRVRAKTGWITSGYTLAGLIKAKDGTWLSFAFFALDDRPVPASAKTALDALAARAWDCGARTSNR